MRSIGIVLVLLGGLFVSAHASEAERTLRMASWGPAGHFTAQARAAWLDAVNERLAGRLQIIEYPGGQLYGPKDIHRAIAKGLIDLGVILQPRLMATVPLLQGTYLPFAFDNLEQAAQAYAGESLAIIDKAMAEKQLKLIYPSFVGAVQIFSNQGPIARKEDFEQLRILATSPMLTEILHRLGAAPDTSIPQTEQYMALKRGVADAMNNSIVGGYFQRSHEVAPYLTMMQLSYPTILMTMNQSVWDTLPADIQQVMLEEGEKQKQRTLALSAAWEAKFTQQISSEGGQVSLLPAELKSHIREVSREVWYDWAAQQGPLAQRLLELNLAPSAQAQAGEQP